MNGLEFAVEEDDRDAKRYKRIHQAGCADLIDPWEFTATDFDDLAYQAVGYGVIDDEDNPDDIRELKAMMKPCAVHEALTHGWSL